MAEKEERIFITTIDRAEDIDEFCVYGRDCMTRQEAIERMAKALYAHTWKSKTPMVRVQNWEIGVTDQNKKKYLGLAEAALNALLED